MRAGLPNNAHAGLTADLHATGSSLLGVSLWSRAVASLVRAHLPEEYTMRKLFVLLVTLVALMLSTMIFSDAALGVQGTGQCGGATSQRCTTTTVKGNSTQANSSFTSSTTKHGN